MKISEFLVSLWKQGIVIEVEQGNLKINAPAGVLSSNLLGVLQDRKEEIVAYLLEEPGAGSSGAFFPRVDRKLPIKASSSQRGLWFQYQLEGVSSTYNIPILYHLKGKLDIPALEKSLQYLIARHESLRICFQPVDGEPYLVIAENIDWGLVVRPFSAASLKQELLELAAQPFSLEQAPLFRTCLWTDSRENHSLLLIFHHTIFDGWSQGLFERELSDVYARIIAAEDVVLPALNLDYADYASWQQDWLQSVEFKQGLAFWREALRGAPELLEFPTDHPRPAAQTFRGGEIQSGLDQGLTNRLLELARREHVTLFMVMYAAFALLLGRYSRQEDVVVGVPMANRSRKELENILGFFVNTLPLRIDLSGNPSLAELLRRVRQTAVDAYANQEVPFEKLVEELRPHRDPGYSPICQVLFDFINTPSQGCRLGNCEAQADFVDISVAKFDLVLMVMEHNGAMELNFQYNSDLFELGTGERMLAHYCRILDWLASAPKENIYDFDLLSDAERRQVLVEWNTKTNYPSQKSIQCLFEEQAAMNPNAPALVFSGQVLTYSELNGRANRLAHALQEMGIGPEQRVGVYVERSLEMIVALVAILKAGGAYVPLDSTYPTQRLLFMLKDTNSPILLTLRRHMPNLPAFDGKVVCIDDGSLYAGRSAENPVLQLAPENLACIMYTSGSTGQPKGSCIPHRAVVRLVKNTYYADFNSQEVFLQFAPLAFDASTFEIWGSLLNGAKLVIFPPHLPGLDELASFVKMNGVTTLWLTAGLFHQVMDWHPEIVDGLHQLLSGGDVLSPRHVRMGLIQNPKCRFINGYGPTENTTFTCCFTVKDLPDLERSIPIGRPIANTSVYILDVHRKPVPVGMVGELYVGGDGLSREYLNQPELTRQKFVPNPFHAQAGARLYRTGDYGRWLPDGNIEFVGRMDNQVKIRGFRIELGEVESALKQHSGIHEALVLMNEDQPGDKRLVGYIIPSTKILLDRVQLRDHLKERLPGYMVPSAFVFLESFPLTVNGKIDRRALPPTENEFITEHYLAPGNDTERHLVSIWQEILGIEKVGIRDNFFELGGHSLLALRLLSRIQDEFGKTLPPFVLFKDSTIETLETHLTSQGKILNPYGVIPIQPEGNQIPVFIVDANLRMRNLAIAMGTSRPIYDLCQYKGGQNGVHASVQEIAKTYYQCLIDYYPQGPYLLLGHSAHGFLALELARLLQKEKKKVAFLGLLDTFPPPPFLLQVKYKIERHLFNLQGKNLLEILKYVGRFAQRWIAHSQNAPAPVNLVEQNQSKRPIKKDKEVINLPYPPYKPKRFDGQVTLFSTNDRTSSSESDPMEKWMKIFTGPFEIVPIPGDHLSMFHPPHVAVLAGKIKLLLAQQEAELIQDKKVEGTCPGRERLG